MKGAGFCLLYQGFYYIEVYYIESRVYYVKSSFIFCTFRGDITFGKLPPPPHVTLGHLLANPPPPMEVTSFVDGPLMQLMQF